MKRLEEPSCRRISYRLNEDPPRFAPLRPASRRLAELQDASGIEVRLEVNLRRAFARMLNLRQAPPHAVPCGEGSSFFVAREVPSCGLRG